MGNAMIDLYQVFDTIKDSDTPGRAYLYTPYV